LQRHLAGYVDSGGRVGLPHFYALLAEVQLAAGERERALESLSAGQQHIDLAGERYYEPELQWLTARMLEAGEKADLRAAAAAYQRAIAAARGQSAKLLELRAAMGLAINERRDGRDPDAIELVRSLCGWFGSESNVPDVARALALLQEEHAGG
jgi:predicted ATPase